MKRAFAATLIVLLFAACGDQGTEAPEAEKPAAAPGAATEAPEPMAKMEEKMEEMETAPTPEASQRTPSPDGAKVFFITPGDGATVYAPVAVQFGVEGIDIAPAGSDDPNSGHHHILIDSSLEDYDSPIPTDEQHKHFGGGQTETALGLSPGQHTLQLILGDKNHIPHDPPVESEVITINVE